MNVKVGEGLPVGMVAWMSLGKRPPSTTKPVGAGPPGGIVQRSVTRRSASEWTRSSTGGSGVAGSRCSTAKSCPSIESEPER